MSKPTDDGVREAARLFLSTLPAGHGLDRATVERGLRGILPAGGRFASPGDAAGYPSPRDMVAAGAGEMTTGEAAAVAKVSRQAIDKAIQAGTLEARAINPRLRLVSAASLAAYIARRA